MLREINLIPFLKTSHLRSEVVRFFLSFVTSKSNNVILIGIRNVLAWKYIDITIYQVIAGQFLSQAFRLDFRSKQCTNCSQQVQSKYTLFQSINNYQARGKARVRLCLKPLVDLVQIRKIV